MALNEGQIITYMVDEVVNTIENNCPMAQRVGKYTPPAGDMQRSQNTIWMPVEQEAPTQKGWDLTNKETGILELSVKCNMGVPDNDFFGLRADDVRDETSLRRRIRASGLKLANNVETSIAKQAAETASLVIADAGDLSNGADSWG
ncbi:P22 phage major capsid protein family protein, partial [Proteus mirabilis]|uniref:P22 phage major capsid protein family protein n=1 Tax=Proteus mirabilis TaxID=584 RepID=UPI003F1C2753